MDTDLIEDIWDESPKSVQDLESLSLHSILMVLGGYIAIGIGSLHFLLTLIERFDSLMILKLLINLIFGFMLLLSYYRLDKHTEKWSVLAGIFSLILIGLGGVVGGLAGLVGFFGAVLAFLSTFDSSFDL
ncbi:MAG: hypothetical protein ACLFSM_03605 [Thermoplasmata archaeon]